MSQQGRIHNGCGLFVRLGDVIADLRWLEERDRQEREDWQRFGQSSFAKAYGPDEPEYTDADLKPELNP